MTHLCCKCKQSKEDYPNKHHVWIYPKYASTIEVDMNYRYMIRLNRKENICLECYLKQS